MSDPVVEKKPETPSERAVSAPEQAPIVFEQMTATGFAFTAQRPCRILCLAVDAPNLRASLIAATLTFDPEKPGERPTVRQGVGLGPMPILPFQAARNLLLQGASGGYPWQPTWPVLAVGEVLVLEFSVTDCHPIAFAKFL
jgi:hypothetical protein